MLILDLWGISFHAVVVFGLGKDLLFKSVLGRCVSRDKSYVPIEIEIDKKMPIKQGFFNIKGQFVALLQNRKKMVNSEF